MHRLYGKQCTYLRIFLSDHLLRRQCARQQREVEAGALNSDSMS